MNSIVEISIEAFKARENVHKRMNVIDVREEWEFIENNIGVLNIPLADIPTRLNEIQHLKSEEIIVHCKSGKRGAQACKYLKSQGFMNVKNLCGGIEAYQAQTLE